MDIIGSMGFFMIGALLASPLGVAIWSWFSNYNGNMGFPIVVLLQIPKIILFASIPYISACVILRKSKYQWTIDFSRVSFYSGILWSLIWFGIFEIFGPISKSLPEHYRVVFIVLVLCILPMVLIFGLAIVFDRTYKRMRT